MEMYYSLFSCICLEIFSIKEYHGGCLQVLGASLPWSAIELFLLQNHGLLYGLYMDFLLLDRGKPLTVSLLTKHK